jgi:hypothetical protein
MKAAIALTEEPSGRRTVRIARASAPWRWGEGRLEHKLSAEAWRGRLLRFSGAVRAEVEEPESTRSYSSRSSQARL